ncbi:MULTISPECIES: hypothetical protein [Marispirochaeta]|uniref:hypothetical protein n=1 Tax=Marispirochaeta TaxID=1911565 RepID=UPI0029C76D54|nr:MULTISPECIES: hypothetical protein [Marispirochaeta]
MLEEKARENQIAGLKQGNDKPVSPTLDKRESIDTLQSAADYSGLSRATIAKAKKVFTEAPDELKEEVRTGKKSIK